LSLSLGSGPKGGVDVSAGKKEGTKRLGSFFFVDWLELRAFKRNEKRKLKTETKISVLEALFTFQRFEVIGRRYGAWRLFRESNVLLRQVPYFYPIVLARLLHMGRILRELSSLELGRQLSVTLPTGKHYLRAPRFFSSSNPVIEAADNLTKQIERVF
jgi:hypothetical protein